MDVGKRLQSAEMLQGRGESSYSEFMLQRQNMCLMDTFCSRNQHNKFIYINVCLCAQSLQSCPTLCNTLDCSPPGSSVHGIFPARTLEWVAMPSSKGSSQPRDRTHDSYVSCIGKQTLGDRSKKILLQFMSKCSACVFL